AARRSTSAMNAFESPTACRFDAFLSHSSKDATLVNGLARSLGAEGLKPWVDESNLRYGALLRDELQASIRDSRVLVLVWSKDAADSRWVMSELFTAFHLNRFIIPCAIDSTKRPRFLDNTAWLDLTRD